MSTLVRDRLGPLRAGLSRLADALLRFDGDPHVLFLTDAAEMTGETRTAAAYAAEAFERLWPGWTGLQEAVEAAQVALDDRDSEAAVAALWIDGRSAEDVLADLERDAKAVDGTAARFSHIWDDTVPRRDALRARVGTLEEQAAAIGRSDDPVVRAARGAVTALVQTVESDPIGADPSIAERAVTDAEQAIRGAVEERDGLPGRLAAARDLLARLPDLVARGRDALEVARQKVVDGGNLLAPQSLDVVDGDDPRALAPWLERIAATLEAGDWKAARAGLEAWERVADGVLRNAERVLAANEAPVRHRDDLRGLLGALRAKAAATGLAEHPGVTAAYDAAREVLWVAPCPLALAERRVLAYRDIVNRGGAE